MNSTVKILIVLILGFILICPGCRKKEERRYLTREEKEEQEEMLIRINKYLVKKDAELIASYVKRRGWNMEVTETGLFYEIYDEGSGINTEVGDDVIIEYSLSLLDGTICYNSDVSGPKEFTLGRNREESGLEQGLLMMREGGKARFILPPHLAHGLLGDEKMIPPRSIIVYDVELTDVIQRN